MKYLVLLISLFVVSTSVTSQSIDLANGIVGNEWIDYDKSYVKIEISEDDVYTLNYQDLLDAGVPVSTIDPRSIRIQHLGSSVPLYTSAGFDFESDDYIVFYGQKNRSELDTFLYENANETMLNDRHSIVNDTSGYFLSWGHPAATDRIQKRAINYNETRPEQRVYNHIDEKVYTMFHYKPVESQDVRYSSLRKSEGYASLFSKEFLESFDVIDKVNVGIDPVFKVRFGTNRNQLNTVISINEKEVKEFSGLGGINHLVKYTTPVDYATITDKLDIKISSFEDLAALIANMSFEYTRTIDASKGLPNVIEILANNEDQYFKIKNYSGDALQVLNLSKNELYDTEVLDNNLIIFVPASSSRQKIALVDNTLEGVKFNTVREFIDFNDFNEKDYIILSSQKLNNENGGSNPVQEYADYRSSDDGGGYNTIIVNVEDLYDQFSFGINRHFLALRHFSFFIKKRWDNPKFIFIIGKGREYANTRHKVQLEDQLNATFYVPTYGVPGSDNLLTAGVDEPTLIIPIGRLAAKNKEDVTTYLDKVTLHAATNDNPQTIEDKLWTKNILHMSGGDKDIQESIRQYLESMETVIEASEMAADVTTFYKFSSDPQQIALSEGLQTLINNGISVLTFFGHSAVGVLDFSIGNVSDFENYGKYPLAIALGCSSGNIHTTSDEGVSEEYVLTKDKGSIAFLASSSSAFASQQYNYGLKFYELFGDTQYGSPIGVTINSVIDSLKGNTSLPYATFMEQLTLHGDPALEIYAYDGPDYIPNGKTALTNPLNVNSYEPNFEFCVEVANIGALNRDSFMVNVKHLYNDGSEAIDTSIRVAPPIYNNQICIKIPILDNTQVGEQTILFKVDAANEVFESPLPGAESNNDLYVNEKLGYKFYVINNTARPVYPQEFAIIDIKRPTLIASSFNAFDEPADYYIQFDTTGTFDSPLLKEVKLEKQRGSIFLETPYELTHNTVYFWRISPDTTADISEMLWVESSFLYHKDIPEGWNQSHYHQLLKDDFENMVLNPASRKLEYTANFADYTIENRIWNNATDRPHYYIDGDSKNVPFTNAAAPGLSVSLVDSLGRPIFTDFPNDEMEFGLFNDRNKPMISYLFRGVDKAEVRQNLIRLLEDKVEDGVLVVINTILGDGTSDLKTEGWAADSISNEYNIFNYLESKGATKVRKLEQKGGVPYVFAYREGEGILNEDIADDIDGEIIVKFLVKGVWFEGNINSTQIGPAEAWKGISWSEQLSINEQNDYTYVKIYGIDANGNMSNIRDSITDKNIDISNINAEEFPFIQLGFYSKDEMDRTSSNLIKWNTIYEGPGDLTIKNTTDFNVYADTLQEGDPFKFTLPVFNYLDKTMENINAIVSVKDLNNNVTDKSFDLGTIAPGETKNLSFQFDTENNIGDYITSVEINKDRNPSEVYYFNNFATQQFHVFREKTNPVLDVTFDGLHILDNDIVSSKPIILVDLKDENPFLLLNEPDLFKIYLTRPDRSIDSLLSDDPRINFIPATESQNNQAKIEFSPIFEQEGSYTLTVQSMDRSDNLQGVNEYDVQFRVVLKEAISEVYNYPNPFSTSTEFIFTLTGSTLPDNIAIQIMTISGKVVKEIKKEELGPLKIGVNRTAYKWNGTDDFGSKLANGVYLYRMMVTQENGDAYKSFDVGVDPSQNHFKKGWGKMVIMR